MKYPTEILKDRISSHQSKIKDLENSEPSFQIDIELSHHEIEGHHYSIEVLQKAIKILNNQL